MPRNTTEENHKIIIPIFLIALNLIATTWANHHAYCQGMEEYDPNLDNPDTTFFIPSASNFCFASVINIVSNILTIYLIFLISTLLQKYCLSENTNKSSAIFYIERISIALMLIAIGMSTEAVFNYLGSIRDKEDMYALDSNQALHCHDISPKILPTLINLFFLSSAPFLLSSPFPQITEEAPSHEEEEADPALNV